MRRPGEHEGSVFSATGHMSASGMLEVLEHVVGCQVDFGPDKAGKVRKACECAAKWGDVVCIPEWSSHQAFKIDGQGEEIIHYDWRACKEPSSLPPTMSVAILLAKATSCKNFPEPRSLTTLLLLERSYDTYEQAVMAALCGSDGGPHLSGRTPAHLREAPEPSVAADLYPQGWRGWHGQLGRAGPP